MSYGYQIDNIATAAELFEKEFQTHFQSAEKLRGTTQEMHGTMGTIQNVPVFDKLEMTQQSSFAPNDISPTHTSSSNVQVVQAIHDLKTVVGLGEKTLFSYNIIQAEAKAHALAVGRAMDKVKIDAVYAANSSEFAATVAVTIGAVTGFSQQKLTNAITAIEDNGADVQMGTTSLWMPALLLRSLYQDDTVTNLFFSNGRPLEQNRISEYLGIDFRRMNGPQAGDNYIPSTDLGGGVTQWAFPLVHKDAVQICYNISPVTNIVWNQFQMRYEAISYMVVGASVIQPTGIALITANDPSVAN